jgi:hypothetical protein
MVLTTPTEDDLMEVDDESEIRFSANGEVEVTADPDTLYGLVLHNNTDTPLFPHVLFFDPTSFSTQIFYQPPNSQSAPLPARRKVQLGRSNECAAAIFFTLDEHRPKEIGFLKVSSTIIYSK